MESNIVLSQVKWAGLSVVFINWLKNSPYFPWFTQKKANLLRVAAAVTSLLTTLGITYTWSASAHQLVFTLPTLAGLWSLLVGWVNSFAVQEITYQATRRNGANGSKAAGIPNPGKYAGQGQKS